MGAENVTNASTGSQDLRLENLVYEVSDRIATITVRRPEVRNALNRRTMDELGIALTQGLGDDAVGAILVTGDGPKAFVAGADIGELSVQTPVSGVATSLHGQAVLARLDASPKPTLAAINGWALGGGCELALACHLRTMASGANIGLPEVGLGIIPGYAGTQRLSRLVGKGRALELILTGDPVDAARAESIGLVNRVFSPDQLISGSRELLGRILTRGPVAVRLALEAVHHGLEMPLAEGAYLEATLFGLACATEDMREGTAAFLEKRKPSFRNR